MIHDRDVVILSSTSWDLVWEANHEIATRLAQAGNRVFYVEHMGFRTPSLRKMNRVFSYAARWIRSARSLGVRQVADGLYVCTPVALPPFGGRLRSWLNRHLLLRLIDSARRRLGMHAPVILTWVPTDSAFDLIRMMRTPDSRLILYCVEDYAKIVSAPERLREVETALLQEADLVLASTESLADWCGRWNPHTMLMNHGVDVAAFSDRAPGAVPSELEHLDGPIIGYVGGLHHAVDYDLLREAIAATPEWNWVFVGPYRDPRASLPGTGNVRHTGWRPHGEVSRYVRAFDVCIIPYREDGATDAVLPTKLYEYLAAGKPVVSTRLRALERLRKDDPVFTTCPANAPEFVAAIRDALTDPGDAIVIHRRRAVAGRNDWSVRMEQISDAILNAGEPLAESQRRSGT